MNKKLFKKLMKVKFSYNQQSNIYKITDISNYIFNSNGNYEYFKCITDKDTFYILLKICNNKYTSSAPFYYIEISELKNNYIINVKDLLNKDLSFLFNVKEFREYQLGSLLD